MTEIIILGVLTIWTITKIKAWISTIDIMTMWTIMRIMINYRYNDYADGNEDDVCDNNLGRITTRRAITKLIAVTM